MIRLLTVDDVADVRALRLEALAACPSAYTSTYADAVDRPLDWFAGFLANVPLFGAFADGELVGMTGLDRGHGNTRHRGTIVAVYLKPAHRGRGLAQAMLDAAVGHARALGLAQVELGVVAGNDLALRLYERFGFRAVATEPRALLIDGVYLDHTLMILPLDG